MLDWDGHVGFGLVEHVIVLCSVGRVVLCWFGLVVLGWVGHIMLV